jgi:hypothetical protein
MPEPVTALAPATFADTIPMVATNYAPNTIQTDPLAYLPPAAARKLTALRQRASDLHSVIPTFEEAREARLVVDRHRQRIADLQSHPGERGFPVLPPDAPQVKSEQKLLERATAELQRLETLRETRSTRWSACRIGCGPSARAVIAALEPGGQGSSTRPD